MDAARPDRVAAATADFTDQRCCIRAASSVLPSATVRERLRSAGRCQQDDDRRGNQPETKHGGNDIVDWWYTAAAAALARETD